MLELQDLVQVVGDFVRKIDPSLNGGEDSGVAFQRPTNVVRWSNGKRFRWSLPSASQEKGAVLIG